MRDTFTLTINLGNGTMQSAEDVAAALRRVARYLHDDETGSGTGGWEHIDGGSVRDDNGNTVGEWEVS